MPKTLEEYVEKYGKALGQSLFEYLSSRTPEVQRKALATIMAQSVQEGGLSLRISVFEALLEAAERRSNPSLPPF